MFDTPAYAGPIDRSAHEILVVDDNPASRYATVRLLNSVGFRTREAVTGTEALKKADASISAMVLDVHLPDIDGLEICRILRAEAHEVRIPVLHLTAAYVKDEDKVRGLDSGADAYLTHPVEPAVLVATVQALVRAHIAEAAMRRSEAKFRALYAQAPSGICLLDHEGRFTDANPALLLLLQRPLSDVVGHRIRDFAPPGWETSDEATRRVSSAGWHGVVPIVDGRGAEVHVEWRVSEPLEPGVTIAVAIDVSERVSLEATRRELLERERAARSDAERVSRLKDDLIAVLSHELRTPLNAIMGWTHVLQKSGGSDESQRGLAAIERNAKTQARLISDILDVSSINMGKLRLHHESIDPAELLATSLDAMRPATDERDCTLVLDVQGPFGDVTADPARFQQIVWNLVSNAVKFSPRGAQVHVRLRSIGHALQLTVSDQGQGIAPEFLPYLFDRFSQGDAASNRFHGGLGLGLSIVRHLAELHGGGVEASSDGVGKGATFTVTLPNSPARDGGSDDAPETTFDDPADAGQAADVLRGISVLVVDDDIEACDMLQLILSERGARVQVVHNAADAVLTIKSQAPDVLVSDIGMPGRDGYELLQDIRRQEAGGSRHLPAIALSSFTRPQDIAQALAAGFDTHCGKPLRPLELVRVIAEQARPESARGN